MTLYVLVSLYRKPGAYLKGLGKEGRHASVPAPVRALPLPPGRSLWHTIYKSNSVRLEGEAGLTIVARSRKRQGSCRAVRGHL
jgi:hypothetical protein